MLQLVCNVVATFEELLGTFKDTSLLMRPLFRTLLMRPLFRTLLRPLFRTLLRTLFRTL
jgi:hypothetical protein